MPLLTVLLVASDEMIQLVVNKSHNSPPELQWQQLTLLKRGYFKMYYLQTNINGLSYSGVKIGYQISHGHYAFLSANFSDLSVGLTSHSSKGTVFKILRQSDSNDDGSLGRFKLAPISGRNDSLDSYTLHLQQLEGRAVRLFLSPLDPEPAAGSSEVYGIQICKTPSHSRKRRGAPKQNRSRTEQLAGNIVYNEVM